MKELNALTVMQEVMKHHADWQSADDWWFGSETPYTNALLGWDANIVDNTFSPDLPDGWHECVVYELELQAGELTSGTKPVLFKFVLPFMSKFDTFKGEVTSQATWEYTQVEYEHESGQKFTLELPKMGIAGNVRVKISVEEV